MEFTFTQHAEDMMERRNIGRREVMRAVSQPSKVLPDPPPSNKHKYRRLFKGDVLEVVALKEDNVRKIITVYLLEEEL